MFYSKQLLYVHVKLKTHYFFFGCIYIHTRSRCSSNFKRTNFRNFFSTLCGCKKKRNIQDSILLKFFTGASSLYLEPWPSGRMNIEAWPPYGFRTAQPRLFWFFDFDLNLDLGIACFSIDCKYNYNLS